MADNLKTRVARVIAGSVHAVLDKIEDAAPVAMLEQSLRELESVTDEVRTELGRIAANRHLAQQQHLTLNREHDDIAQSLEAALSASRDDLATTAIGRQLDIEAQLPILETTLSDLAQQEKELSGYVDALKGKQREMQAAIAAFEQSRREAESAARTAGNATGKVSAKVDAAQNSFDRTYRRATGLEAMQRQATLEQSAKLKELTDMVRDNRIAERLATLKNKREA